MNSNTIYKIKDSVDLFLSNDSYIMAYYMNTRQRKSFRVNKDFVYLLENIDGKTKLIDLYSLMYDKDIDKSEVDAVINMLLKNRIITEVIDASSVLCEETAQRYKRQINYFSEFYENERDGLIAQAKLSKSTVLIFGCGAVGGNIAMQLGMTGVGNLILYDSDIIDVSDVSRHMYFCREYVGEYKTTALKKELHRINSDVIVRTINESMCPQTEIEELIKESDFVVNTLDEPYIGYTSSKISRLCVKHNIPHYIAGGFDAHLASTGELIIPYVTPCVECYTKHFKTVLKDWKPSNHPVKTRYEEIGGLSCLSLFSASYACIEIVKYLVGLIDMESNYKVRGEFLFTDMSLTYLKVEKNPDCIVCGGNRVE